MATQSVNLTKPSQPNAHKNLTLPPPGPQVFRNNDAPRYFIAFSTHMGCYVLLLLVIVFLRFYLRGINKRRDASAEKDERNVHAFEDLTDKENVNFRYVY